MGKGHRRLSLLQLFFSWESWKGVIPIPTLLQPLLCPGHPAPAATQNSGTLASLRTPKLHLHDLLLVLPLSRAAGEGDRALGRENRGGRGACSAVQR